MTSLDDLLPYVNGDAMDMPATLIKRHLLDSAISFADDSGCVREVISIAANVDEDTFNVTLSSGLEKVAGIISVKLDGSDATYSHSNGVITLDNAVSVTGTLEVECYIKPNYGIAEISDVLANTYRDGVVAGALYRIKKTGGGNWTDGNGAMFNKQLFDMEVSNAKYDMITENTNKTFTLKPVRFI